MSDANQNEKKSGQPQDSHASSINEQEENKEQPSIWEWVIAAIGLVLVVGAIGFVLYQAIWGSEVPPDVQIQIKSIQPVSSGYLVIFSIRNQSGATLEGVLVEAELKRGEEKIESSQTTIDFVPAHSNRKGGFFFRKNPHAYSLETRASGYQQP